jgi:hypothetical protein
MILAPVEAALKTALAALVTDWPIRWLNEVWASDIPQSQGDLPLTPEGDPAPFIDAEVIGGSDGGDIAPAGMRHSQSTGLFRIYLCVAQGTGTDAITAKADAISAAFKRSTVWTDRSVGQCLRTLDCRTDDGIAAYEDASRFVRMISIPWTFDYLS